MDFELTLFLCDNSFVVNSHSSAVGQMSLCSFSRLWAEHRSRSYGLALRAPAGSTNVIGFRLCHPCIRRRLLRTVSHDRKAKNGPRKLQ